MTLTALPGKRALDAALNLVPFIDLLSCCIAFLLITAVWSQSAQLPARTAGGETEEGGAASFTLLVARDGCTLSSPSGTYEDVPHAELAQRLRTVGEQLTVIGSDQLPYDIWIRALDSARAAGVVNLDVSLRL
jgi:biopolymer transport protein ExbD